MVGLPMVLRLEGRPVVVVGGGSVGRRKAQAALDAGAEVHLIALEPQPLDFTHSRLRWVATTYRPDVLTGVAVVFAAATPSVNEQVVLDARTRGVWVCSATDPTGSDFTLPAVGRCGGLTLAVDTHGAAPALARRVRDQLIAGCDEWLAPWIELLAEMRPRAREAIADTSTRRAVLDGLADWPWLARLRRDGRDATRVAMIAVIRSAAGG